MAWLPHGEKISKMSLFVLAQLTNVTDGRTLHDGTDCAYALHHAVKTPDLSDMSEEDITAI